MKITRRIFLGCTTSLLICASTALSAAPTCEADRTRVIAFDAFPIFDPRPIFALGEDLFPGRGDSLGEAWRTRQFQYQWLRALSDDYANFWEATEESLIFAAQLLGLELTDDKRSQLMQAYLRLDAWPEVRGALAELKKSGYQLAFLSNATPEILHAGINNAGLDSLFDQVLSTDAIKTYKPDPRAYGLALHAFSVEKQEVLFVAFAGWDVAGAKAFGYPTFWVNRLSLPPERLGHVADGVGRNLNDVVEFVRKRCD